MKDKKDQTRQLLIEVYKGADMAEKAISMIGEKTASGDFSRLLFDQGAQYARVFDDAAHQLKNYGGAPQISPITTLPLVAGVNMKTLTDKSESNLARLLIDGSTMGITGMHDAIAEFPAAEQSAVDLAHRLTQVSDGVIEEMRKFL